MAKTLKPRKPKLRDQQHGRAMQVPWWTPILIPLAVVVIGLVVGNRGLVEIGSLCLAIVVCIVLYIAMQTRLDQGCEALAARVLRRAGRKLGDERDDIEGLAMKAMVALTICILTILCAVLGGWIVYQNIRYRGAIALIGLGVCGTGLVVARAAGAIALPILWDVIAGGSALTLITSVESAWKAITSWALGRSFQSGDSTRKDTE